MIIRGIKAAGFGAPCAIALTSLVLAGCMVGPDYERPPEPTVENWHADLTYQDLKGETLTDIAWFDIFQDEELRELIKAALEQNKNLLVAIERITEARATNRIARAALYPRLDLDFLIERESESKLTNDNAEQDDEYFFGASAAWELDLWGGNRRASNAAFARYLSAEYGAQAVRLTVIADVCIVDRRWMAQRIGKSWTRPAMRLSMPGDTQWEPQ